MKISQALLDELTARAKATPKLRINYDLRTTPEDGSQRMLNAIEPGSRIPIHRHTETTEVVVMLRGKGVQYYYDDNGNVIDEIHLEAGGVCPAMSVEKGQWHSLVSLESGTVIFEAKDGPYRPQRREDVLLAPKVAPKGEETEKAIPNSIGDLRKNIEYLIGMERMSGSMEVITPLYVSRMLHVPLAEVEACMKEMGI